MSQSRRFPLWTTGPGRTGAVQVRCPSSGHSRLALARPSSTDAFNARRVQDEFNEERPPQWSDWVAKVHSVVAQGLAVNRGRAADLERWGDALVCLEAQEHWGELDLEGHLEGLARLDAVRKKIQRPKVQLVRSLPRCALLWRDVSMLIGSTRSLAGSSSCPRRRTRRRSTTRSATSSGQCVGRSSPTTSSATRSAAPLLSLSSDPRTLIRTLFFASQHFEEAPWYVASVRGVVDSGGDRNPRSRRALARCGDALCTPFLQDRWVHLDEEGKTEVDSKLATWRNQLAAGDVWLVRCFPPSPSLCPSLEPHAQRLTSSPLTAPLEAALPHSREGADAQARPGKDDEDRAARQQAWRARSARRGKSSCLSVLTAHLLPPLTCGSPRARRSTRPGAPTPPPSSARSPPPSRAIPSAPTSSSSCTRRSSAGGRRRGGLPRWMSRGGRSSCARWSRGCRRCSTGQGATSTWRVPVPIVLSACGAYADVRPCSPPGKASSRRRPQRRGKRLRRRPTTGITWKGSARSASFSSVSRVTRGHGQCS